MLTENAIDYYDGHSTSVSEGAASAAAARTFFTELCFPPPPCFALFQWPLADSVSLRCGV